MVTLANIWKLQWSKLEFTFVCRLVQGHPTVKYCKHIWVYSSAFSAQHECKLKSNVGCFFALARPGRSSLSRPHNMLIVSPSRSQTRWLTFVAHCSLDRQRLVVSGKNNSDSEKPTALSESQHAVVFTGCSVFKLVFFSGSESRLLLLVSSS